MLKERGKKALARAFEVLQRVGVDVLPRHFYSSVPDIAKLRATSRWRAPRSLVGVAGTGIEGQAQFLAEVVPTDMSTHLRQHDVFGLACEENGALGYGPVEAAFLYAFICAKRPRKVVQIGAGVSTSVVLQAADATRYTPAVTAIEPYPTVFLHTDERVRVVVADAQDVPIKELTELAAGDLLFVDSTHTVRTDSEVNRIVLDVLPRLQPGVWVHFHDIYFPYDYQRSVLEPTLFFWSESTLVHAFLACNSQYRIAAALSMLHYAAPEKLAERIPSYRPQPNDDGLSAGEGHFPSSLYMVSRS